MPTRIPAHRPPRVVRMARRDESARPNAYRRGYTDKVHKAWRQAVLTRDAWACVDCGKVDNSNHADHIVPIADGGGRYDLANGATRCVRCHGIKTRAEQNKKQQNAMTTTAKTR